MISKPRSECAHGEYDTDMVPAVYIVVTFFTLLGFFYQDTLGRRLALICGSSVMAISMIGFSSIAVAIPDLQGAAGKGCVAISKIWETAYILESLPQV